jgi:hypothetical protein
MMRAGLPAALLVLLLGTVAVAQVPSPEAISPNVRDDVASLLPTRVGDVGVEVAWAGTGLAASDSRDAAFWRDFLAAYGKEAADLQSATGVVVPPGESGPDALPLVIRAVCIEGVPASRWAESYWSAVWDTFLAAGLGGEYLSEWRDIDGHDVYAVVWTPEVLAGLRALDPSMHLSADTGYWLYPVGEVVFLVIIPFDRPVPTPSIEDVLAGLP